MSEALERKARSEQILAGAGIGVNPALPTIEASEDVEIRHADEVAPRALCLVLLSAKGAGMPNEVISSLVDIHGAEPFFTPAERAFYESAGPSEEDMVAFSWAAEAARPLFWALGFLGELGLPNEESTADDLVDLIEEHRLEGLISRARMRRAGEILDRADLIYRCHWAVRQAELDGNPHACPLNPSVTMERHRALNWLIGSQGQEWDDVSTDT